MAAFPVVMRTYRRVEVHFFARASMAAPHPSRDHFLTVPSKKLLTRLAEQSEAWGNVATKQKSPAE
jgi:hypothetical protein